jgi:ABC-2 type transport system permease protein
MREVVLVARREVRERLRARSFRIATVISAGVIVAAIAIPAANRGHVSTYDVGLVNPPTAQTADTVKSLAPTLAVKLRVTIVATEDDARAEIRTGKLDVAAVGDARILTKQVLERDDTSKKAQLVAAVGTAVRLQAVVARQGPAALETLTALRTPVPSQGVEPRKANTSQRLTAFYGVVLLFIFLQQYGQLTLTGVVEEKSSRVVEILLSAIRPRQLVSGKVLGIGVVALTQTVIVAAAALITAKVTNTHVFHGATQLSVLWAAVWFLLGYAFYAWLYAAVGSLVSRQADAQNAAFPVALPLFVGYFSTFSLLGGGEPSGFVHVLGFLPPTAPLIMPMLIGLGKVSGIEIALSVAITAAGVVVLSRVAAEIYSRAILHTGRRLKLREVFKLEAT